MTSFVELVERVDAIFSPQTKFTLLEVEQAVRELERQHGVLIVEKARIFSHRVAAEAAVHQRAAANPSP